MKGKGKQETYWLLGDTEKNEVFIFLHFLVMSSSRRILGLARSLFHFSLKSKIGRKQAEIGFSVEDLYLIIFYNKLVLKMIKLCR